MRSSYSVLDHPQKVGESVRAARLGKGLSIRAAAERLNCSPRFLHELERGKPTARMDKVVQAMKGLGLALDVRALGQDEAGRASAGRVGPPNAVQIEARMKQRLYEERLAAAHLRLSGLLALGSVGQGEIDRARAQVRKWGEARICSPWYIERWNAVLTGSGPQIGSQILALGSDDARALFQNTPFGFLVREYLRP